MSIDADLDHDPAPAVPPPTAPTVEVSAYRALDDIFGTNPAETATAPMDVTIFLPTDEGLPHALYVDGLLEALDTKDNVYARALAMFGARVVSDDAHMLGGTDPAGAAPDLAAVVAFINVAEEAEALRQQAEALIAQAEALRAQAAELQSRATPRTSGANQ